MKYARQLAAVLPLGGLLLSIPACGGSVPDTPDATVKHAFASLAKDDPGALWDMLPASYQKDVDGLITDFASKVEPELYDAGAGSVQKLVEVLRQKRDYVLAFPMLQMMPIDKGDLEKNWDDVTAMVAAVAASELGSHAGLKGLDVGAFLGSTGKNVMSTIHKLAPEAQWPDFANAGAELVESEGDTATLKLTMPGEAETTEAMKKVDGRWLPEGLVKEWPDFMKQAREGITEMAPASEAETKQALAQLKQFDGLLDELLAADSQEKFDQAIGKLMGGR